MNTSILLHDEHISYLFASARHCNVECISHLHHSMEIILVTQGTLSMNISGIDYRITAGQAVFVPPFEAHAFHSPENNHCQVLMFLKELLPQFFDFLQKNKPNSHLFSFSSESAALVHKYLPEDTGDVDRFHALAALMPLVCDIWEQCSFSPRTHRQDDLLYKIVTHMNEHFVENISLSSTAKAVGIHPVTLSRLFSEKFKNNFPTYLNYLRCSQAAILLKTSNTTCSEIAYLVGFGSIRSFNRAFHTLYGLTPTEYRQAANAVPPGRYP